MSTIMADLLLSNQLSM